MTAEIVIIFVLLVINGIFAMSEIAVVSSRRARLQQLLDEGHHRARTALDLANSPNRFLSTVQIGITLVGIVAGAFGGATLAEDVAVWLNRIPAIQPYSEEIAFGLVVLFITFFSLVIGELVPKRIGLQNPERIALAVARPMNVISRITSPVVTLLSKSTDLTLRLLRVKPSQEPTVTEEEISVMLAEGAEAGVFAKAEREMVERVFRFADQSVGSVMTPRTEVVFLDLRDPFERNREKILEETHSVFIVCEGGLDQPVGIVRAKDLLAQNLRGEPIDLLSALHRPPYIPESLSALVVLERFKQSGEHIALIVDEYGGVAGLITLDDILEAIVGDIPWLGEENDRSVVEREDGSFLVEAMLPVEEFRDVFRIRAELPGEETGAFRTLGGFVITHLGRIPTVAERFSWGGYTFEVVDMDGNRIDKVLIVPEIVPDEKE